MRPSLMLRMGMLALLVGTLSLKAAEKPRDLAPDLSLILAEANVPALAAAAISRDGLQAIGAAGIRKRGEKDTVSLTDKFHLGSCTKPMTATLTAILIEEGLLKWDTTIADVLGKKIRGCHEDYKEVTVEQLLSHVGGFPTAAPAQAWQEAWASQGKKKPVAQRLEFIKQILSQSPSYPPGTKTEYSNQGFAVLGVMLETLAKKPWETLMRDRLFKPLGMKSAGFRAPCDPRRLDHPWGHSAAGTPIAPMPNGDNPDAIGPAGTVHATIGDWAKFAQFHLERKPGTLLNEAASFDKLHAVLPTSGQHGIGGWVLADRADAGGRGIEMNGSNTMWYARLRILPARNLAVVVTTNTGEKQAYETCDQVASLLIKEFAQE